jgi:hypothetical protein
MQTPTQPLLKVGDELDIVGTNKTVAVTKATPAFATLSDGNKVRQSASNGEYHEYIPCAKRGGLSGVANSIYARYYRLRTPEYLAEKARILEQKRAEKARIVAEKLAQILQKLQSESVPNDAIDIIHSVLFHAPSKPIPTPEGYWLIKNPNR